MKIRSYWIFFALSVVAIATFIGLLVFNEFKHGQTHKKSGVINRALPNFSLSAHNGSTISRAELLGKVWVANFIFTTCPGPCLQMTSEMREVQNRLPGKADVRFISFTVNPAFDTPQVLAEYAAKFDADSRWLFLTGDKQVIYDLAQKGFLFNAVDTGDGAKRIEDQFIHDTRFAIVDRTGVVRTYIDGADKEAPAKIAAAVKHFLTSSNPP